MVDEGDGFGVVHPWERKSPDSLIKRKVVPDALVKCLYLNRSAGVVKKGVVRKSLESAGCGG